MKLRWMGNPALNWIRAVRHTGDAVFVRRKLRICEHRARDPRNLAVAFTPNSQRVVFQSDHEGKPALYIVNVERFVEETES